MTAASRHFLFGTMFVPSTDAHGKALLTWYRAASRARTSALPATATASTASAPGSGGKCPESSARYDRATCSWKTHQLSLDGDWEPYSETWPRWGMMRGGEFWELPTPELPTSATASGLSLPTLVKRDGKRVDCPGERRRNSPPLITRLGMLPTLTAQDAKNCGGPSQMERNTPPLNALVGGPLNPEWCEWFMGCPLGWTALSALETDRLATWCRSRGMSSADFRNE